MQGWIIQCGGSLFMVDARSEKEAMEKAVIRLCVFLQLWPGIA